MTGPRPFSKILANIPSGYAGGILAGLLVGIGRVWPAAAPLQLPAFALLAWALMRGHGLVNRLRPGFWFGATMAGVVLAKIGVPPQAAVILFVAMTSYWTALGVVLSRLLQLRGFTGALAAAGALTLGEWAQSVALPMFGTAQRFAAAWVDYDAALPLSRIGGTTLIAFVVATLAYGLVTCRGERTGFRPKGKQWALLGGAGLIAITGTFSGLSRREGYSRGMTVAVCGVNRGEQAFMAPDFFLKKYRPMLAAASAQGARLAVTPEMGLCMKQSEEKAVLLRCAETARELGLVWALGYALEKDGRIGVYAANRAVLLNAGMPVGEAYDKTHWVPFMENYDRHGGARAVTGMVGDVKVGLMICQDDNYEEVARNLSREGVQIAAVPTFDWPGVEFGHLQSARNRPRESGFAEARAAIGGISAILGETGRVSAARNHLKEGDGMIVGTVNIDGGSPTLFARTGNLPTLLIAGFFALNGLRRLRSPVQSSSLRSL